MSSSITLTSASYGGRYLQLSCTQAKDVANNRSVISWTLSSVGGDVNYYSTGPTTVTINGQQVYYKGRVSWQTEEFPAKKGSVSGTITVDHNTDGNKTIPVSLSTRIYYTTVKTTSEDWELDTIERGARLTYAPNFTDTTLPTIYYTNPRGNAVTSLDACIADSVGWYAYAPYRDLSKTGTSYTFTAEDMALLKNKAGNALTVMFIIRTVVDGKTYTDYLVRTLTMTENADTKPSVSISLSPSNPSSMPSSLAGTYIQGKSRVTATVYAEGKYNATPVRYLLSVGGVANTSASNTITSDAITKPGSVEVIGSAVDSRGFTGTKSQTITVLEYSKPLVVPLGNENAILCYRSDGNGNRVGGSTSVWIKAKRSFHSLNGNNRCSLQWRSKRTAEVWNDNEHKWVDLIPKTTTNTDEYNALVSGEFLLKESYAVQIRAVDDVGESDVKELEIPTQDVALHLGKGGKNVTIGEYCDYSEEYTFRSAWKAYFDNGINGTMTQQPALGDMLTFAEECPQGLTPFYTGGSTTNVPETGNYLYASGFVCKRSDTQITVVIFSYYSGDLAINTYYDTAGGWLGWRYLKTTTS